MSTTETRGREPEAHASPVRGAGFLPLWAVTASLVIIGFGAAMIVLVVQHSGSSRTPHLYEYTIEPGTSARIEAGEKLYVFPAHLDVHVGDQLVIHNDDTRVIEVGPYTVDRNSTLVQSFTRPGTIVGICTIHPSGRVTIDVRA